MNAQDLKNSILQLAIQGKLVEQRKEEGTARELIDQLKASKDYLLREKKIYSKKATEPFYKNEEFPFDIPESWCWVQLSDISIIQEGAGIRKYQYKEFGTQLFSVTNILDGSIDLEKKQLYVSTEEFQEKYTHLQLNKGDIVTACSGGSWGKVAIYDKDDIVMLNTSTLRLRFFEDIGDNSFLYYIVQSAFFKQQLKEQLVGMQPNFGYAHYSRICLPIPPLAEQNRIVAKIEELMPYIEKYGVAHSKLEEFNKKFPEDMQKSILQYAIQGKLVEQREEDGTAEELYKQIQEEKEKLIKEKKIKKEKPLTEITEDEVPFEIPESWKWVRLGEITSKLTDGSHNPPPNTGNGYYVISAKNIKNEKITFENVERYTDESGFSKENKRTNITRGDIILGIIGGSIGNIATYDYDEKVIAQRSIAIIDTLVNNQYIKRVIQSPLIQFQLKSSSGTAQGGVYLGTLNKVLIPLPPLSEQKRIVAKIEEMLPYCKQLVK